MRYISPLKIVGVVHFLGLFIIVKSLNGLAHWVNRTNGNFDFLFKPYSYIVIIPYLFFGFLIFYFDNYINKLLNQKDYWATQVLLSLLYLLPVLIFYYPKVKHEIANKTDKTTQTIIMVPENFNGEAGILYGFKDYPKLPEPKFLKKEIFLPEDGFLFTSSESYKFYNNNEPIYKGVSLNTVNIANASFPCTINGPDIAYTYIYSTTSDNQNMTKVLKEMCDSFKAGSLVLNERKPYHKLFFTNNQLIMNNYPLCVIPGFFDELTITGISMQSCGLFKFPKFIQDISNLEKLDLSGNPISSFPRNWEVFGNLKKLNISSTKIQLPNDMSPLANLQQLEISNNNIKELPYKNLQNLTALNVSNNKIQNIDSNLANLQNLFTLNLEGNQIDSIPDCITLLPNLVNLNISNNPITYISPAIMNLKTLSRITALNTLLTPKQKRDLEMYYLPNCTFEWEIKFRTPLAPYKNNRR